MTARPLTFADPGEAASLAAFLKKLLRWEKAAAVRLQAGRGVLGVFAQPARFEVFAVLTARLLEPIDLDATVSAGELLERVDETGESVAVPVEVTGPSWAGLLPPRSGWRAVAALPPGTARRAAEDVISEFRQRTERLPSQDRTRQLLDGLAEEIWERRLRGTELPLRAAHAAHALGFLSDRSAPNELYDARGWLRLRTARGSVIVRTESGGRGPGHGLSVTPV
ncbi:hypothetical protein [Streptomyces oceani]|uniref:Uncharacterized protein n=1 Tax=Streptomyces oceani TaxID=1075402 RepID=A0A1E7KFS0_9ACTN|nr:hypothetical protein [Streptomyces oceani]OEV02779.1 hypothetical protein AN216_15145 [Streptomyces oceani]